MLTPSDLDRLRVVLVATRNPLNIGAAARAMSNFGFSRLRLVNPYEPSFQEARSAVGAAAMLEKAETFSSVADAVADCTLVVGTTAGRDRQPQQAIHRLPDAAPLLRRELARGPVALLFGSEKRGLSNHDLSYCHWTVHIPTREDHLSMNLGQAVAVCVYELVREPQGGQQMEPGAGQQLESGALASAGDLERITLTLLDALRESGYVQPDSAAASEEKMRRLVRRLGLQAEDAELLQGMLRQILWKLRAEK